MILMNFKGYEVRAMNLKFMRLQLFIIHSSNKLVNITMRSLKNTD